MPGNQANGAARHATRQESEETTITRFPPHKTEVTEAGESTDSVAVLVGRRLYQERKAEMVYQDRSKEQLTGCDPGALGDRFDQKRGDQVEVVNLGFRSTEVLRSPATGLLACSIQPRTT